MYYKNGDKAGEPIINLEVAVEGRVEFLSNQSVQSDASSDEGKAPASAPAAAQDHGGFTAVETDELPFWFL